MHRMDDVNTFDMLNITFIIKYGYNKNMHLHYNKT